MRSPGLPPIAVAVLVIVGAPLLSACEQMENFELFETKKKLAGERKPVFPEGIPGVVSGVPPELMKGYREPEGIGIDPAQAAAQAAAAAHDQRPKPKPPQQRPTKPPASVAAAPAQSQSSSPPAYAPAPPQPPQTASPQWPSTPPQAASPPWPGAPSANTATR